MRAKKKIDRFPFIGLSLFFFIALLSVGISVFFFRSLESSIRVSGKLKEASEVSSLLNDLRFVSKLRVDDFEWYVSSKDSGTFWMERHARSVRKLERLIELIRKSSAVNDIELKRKLGDLERAHSRILVTEGNFFTRAGRNPASVAKGSRDMVLSIIGVDRRRIEALTLSMGVRGAQIIRNIHGELAEKAAYSQRFVILFCILAVLIGLGVSYGVGYVFNERRKSERLAVEHGRRLQAIANQLKVSNSDLEQFAYVASHDLQAPLRHVSSFTQLMVESLSSKNPDPEIEGYANRILTSVNKMQTLIRDLLAFSRVQYRKVNIEKIDLNKLLGELSNYLEPELRENQGKLIFKDLPTIEGRPTQIQQLFQNLVGNALKFQRKGVPPCVEITASEKEEHYEIRVSDNGIGIQPQYAAKIFDVFQRLHGDKQYPGNGIGLSICKKIVQLHGGEIQVVSNEGKPGACFVFTLSRHPNSV